MRIDDAHLRGSRSSRSGSMKKKKKKKKKERHDRRQKKKRKSFFTDPYFFREGEILCKLSKNLREFCVLFWGGVKRRSPKKK